jgi:hypothetical protein
MNNIHDCIVAVSPAGREEMDSVSEGVPTCGNRLYKLADLRKP